MKKLIVLVFVVLLSACSFSSEQVCTERVYVNGKAFDVEVPCE